MVRDALPSFAELDAELSALLPTCEVPHTSSVRGAAGKQDVQLPPYLKRYGFPYSQTGRQLPK